MVSARAAVPDPTGVFEAMRDEWRALHHEHDPIPDWEEQFAVMCAEEEGLRARGLWRTGGRTLLHEMGLHRSEVHLCRGLAWLLTPDGWHGLGEGFLSGLLSALAIPTDGAARALVVTEESRAATRADIVVRLPQRTLLIEAKVFALEQPRQCDRLAHEWADEAPHLMFLTRRGVRPSTAVESRDAWKTMTWRQVAQIAKDVAAANCDVSHGALEFIDTLYQYGDQ